MCFIKKNLEEVKTKNIGHLGLIAGMAQELQIIEMIDSNILGECDRVVSHGEAVLAMILNAMGFSGAPLYMTPRFFEDKPVNLLIGEHIEANHLNDVTLGRTLDKLYESNLTELFSKISANSARILGLDSNIAHLDSSSFSVQGEYNSQSEDEDGVVKITKGYSRDHRPDLNQIMLNLIVENRASLPIYLKICSGNQSDKIEFGKILDDQISNLVNFHGIEYVVVDSALYTKNNIEKLEKHDTFWITRVPKSLNISKEIALTVNSNDFIKIDEKHSFLELGVNYNDINQRYIVVQSKDAEERAKKSTSRLLEEISQNDVIKIKKLQNKKFKSKESALECLNSLKRGLKVTDISSFGYLEITEELKTKTKKIYKLNLICKSDIEIFENECKKRAMFILATNQLDSEKLTPEDILNEYKNQGKVERGFRFLKDPKFHADSIFLHKPERVIALMMVMTLSLLVYSALEYKIREKLKKNKKSFPDQKGKPTNNPTARWVFQYFFNISLLIFKTEVYLQYFDENHRNILSLLGKDYEKFYQ